MQMHARIQIVLSDAVHHWHFFFFFFFIYKGEMAFRWGVDNGPRLNAGLVALWSFRGAGPVMLRNPIFL